PRPARIERRRSPSSAKKPCKVALLRPGAHHRLVADRRDRPADRALVLAPGEPHRAHGTGSGRTLRQCAQRSRRSSDPITQRLAPRSRWIEGASDPDDPNRVLFETGGLLPARTPPSAAPTFEQWLNSAS
ncbi:MAG TPA: hypothetical protein VGJ70_05495, partial [Solirubrobacteraceae bacterium]